MGRLMKWLSEWLGSFPSTNGRIVSTILVMWATATRYLLSGIFGIGSWNPSYEWLVFLAVTMGIDAAQYSAKRLSWQPAPPKGGDAEDVGPKG